MLEIVKTVHNSFMFHVNKHFTEVKINANFHISFRYLKNVMKNDGWGHSFSTYVKHSEKTTFLTP